MPHAATNFNMTAVLPTHVGPKVICARKQIFCYKYRIYNITHNGLVDFWYCASEQCHWVTYMTPLWSCCDANRVSLIVPSTYNVNTTSVQLCEYGDRPEAKHLENDCLFCVFHQMTCNVKVTWHHDSVSPRTAVVKRFTKKQAISSATPHSPSLPTPAPSRVHS